MMRLTKDMDAPVGLVWRSLSTPPRRGFRSFNSNGRATAKCAMCRRFVTCRRANRASRPRLSGPPPSLPARRLRRLRLHPVHLLVRTRLVRRSRGLGVGLDREHGDAHPVAVVVLAPELVARRAVAAHDRSMLTTVASLRRARSST